MMQLKEKSPSVRSCCHPFLLAHKSGFSSVKKIERADFHNLNKTFTFLLFAEGSVLRLFIFFKNGYLLS